ncbi:hypothetical protein OSCT_0310 [Oscillochloris trichoides DG-6]|uniref:Uncharacterized protein n=1 Tax=Oscillochloris trichoides DG-6 TaxID=765420 RepID=E1IAF9_9CHLR|nr:hypothetical protein OSCT_0310 [Oscillochloris trichoides DG-6]
MPQTTQSRTRCFNPPGGFGAFGTALVTAASMSRRSFQSAGRIWGFRNSKCRHSFEDEGTEVSIRRADLGLSEPNDDGAYFRTLRVVSIRRADLGLSELLVHRRSSPWMGMSFNPPGGFGAFGTSRRICQIPDVA